MRFMVTVTWIINQTNLSSIKFHENTFLFKLELNALDSFKSHFLL